MSEKISSSYKIGFVIGLLEGLLFVNADCKDVIEKAIKYLREIERKLGIAEDHFKKIKDARLNNPNQEMGDLLLYKSEIAREALAQIREEGG